MEKFNLYILTGPTASGKTSISIELAKRMNTEIVSADSIQIYRGMDIGSAKPTKKEQQGITHHMIDVALPTERDYSVIKYRDSALESIFDINARGKKPLVVGGTGLYINALIYPLNFPSVPPDTGSRAYWKSRESEEKGSAYKRLAELDFETAERLHPNDVKRVIRAIEICEGTGKTLSELGVDFTRRDDDILPYHPVMAGLTMPRELLYARIEQRVDVMVKAGLEDEVRNLLFKGVQAEMPAMQGLGYKQMASYLTGACSLSEAVETIKRETRHFAKRQLTWFRRDERIRWFDVSQYRDAQSLVNAIHNYFTEEIRDG